MDFNHTQQQTSDEEARAQALSLKPARPPLQLPGYEPKRFLGAGAYGEVWVALDRTTGRQVAIKFYAHQGGLDWSILSREVEKLAFLSADRYVVQLLDVGWDADPPYYVMEYVEQGSLEDLLAREGRLPARDAVNLFREISVGLLHAHGKGVLHCDMKPANVLLDQDMRPRIADFGQSRLSHEQTPALGTLFYMAPEQADLQAVPDVRWDVYALGALLYCMLTGAPPHRNDAAVTEFETATDLEERLTRYRQLIETSPPASKHRQVAGVDRELAEIVDGCLAVDRRRRYANVQEVLDALIGSRPPPCPPPAGALGFCRSGAAAGDRYGLRLQFVRDGDDRFGRSAASRALESNQFAANFVAKTVTNKLEFYYRAVEEMAASARFQNLLETTLDNPEIVELRRQLNDPRLDDAKREELRTSWSRAPRARTCKSGCSACCTTKPSRTSQAGSSPIPRVCNWPGLPEHATVGNNFGWRTYFHGGSEDFSQTWRPRPDDHITKTNLSAVFYSQVNDRWTVTISTPVIKELEDQEAGKFLGVIGLSVDVGRFVAQEEDSAVRGAGRLAQRTEQGFDLATPAVRQVAGRRQGSAGPISRRIASRMASCPTATPRKRTTSIRWPRTRRARNTTSTGWPRAARSAFAMAIPAGW